MIIVIRRLKAQDKVLYSVLDTRPLQVLYAIRTHEELVNMYETADKFITGFNYRVINNELVFKTTVGTSLSVSAFEEGVTGISLIKNLNPQNVWTAISDIIYNDFSYRILIQGREERIESIAPISSGNGLLINGVAFDRMEKITFLLKEPHMIEEIAKDLGMNNDFISARGTKVQLDLSKVSFGYEFMHGSMQVLMSNIAPTLKQLLTEYLKILEGFVTAYSAFSVNPDKKGDDKLHHLLNQPGVTLKNAISVLMASKEYTEEDRELYAKGIQEYIDNGNHSSLTYSLDSYFIYEYKKSEITLIKLLICNCG